MGTSGPELESDADEVFGDGEDPYSGGDYELRWATNGDKLIPAVQTITFNADDEYHLIDVIPFYDIKGEPAESVVAEIDAVLETGTPPATVYNDLIIEEDSAAVTIAKSPMKPCVCLCSLDGSAGGAGVNSTMGNLGTGDHDNNVMYYSSFANDKQVILADSGLATTSGGDALTYVRAELFFNESATANETVWYDGSTATASGKYSFAFSVDVTGLSTGIYDWEVKLTEYYGTEAPNTPKNPTKDPISGTTSVINTAISGNDVGKGWFIFGLPKIMDMDGNDLLLLRGGLQQFKYDASSSTWEQAASDDTSSYTLTKEYDSELSQYVYLLTAKDSTVEKFSAATGDTYGQIISKTDSNGRVTTYTYVDGNLTEIEEPGDLTTTYSYHTVSGLLTQVTDPAGRITTYEHDEDGRIVAITKPDPDGIQGPLPAPVTRYEYDTFVYDTGIELLTRIIAPDGGATEIEYDYAGCVSKVTHADGSVCFASVGP